VITRNRENAADVWMLSVSEGRWFLVETNWDHWKPPGDDRRQTAINGMNNCGHTGDTLACMYSVLSTPNVLNSGTTYTTLMSASNSTYTTTIRNL